MLMATKTLRFSSLLSILLLAGACDVGANDGARSVREIVSDTTITLPGAIDLAAAGRPAGSVVAAELEVENAEPVYEVRILEAGALTKIHVHPDSGAIVGQERDADVDDVAEASAAAELIATAKVDAAAAIATAEAERAGSRAFEYEVKDGRIEVEVASEAGLFEVYIDPNTGAVVKVEASDDDHHGGGDDDGDDDHHGGDDTSDDHDDTGGDDTAGDDTGGDHHGDAHD